MALLVEWTSTVSQVMLTILEFVAAHSSYSGNVTVTLPVVSGTVIVGGAVTNTTDITTSGDISATNFNSTSDITLKDNVSIIDNALDMINNLEGIDGTGRTVVRHLWVYLLKMLKLLLLN